MKFAIIGAGFSGAVLARELSKNGYRVDLFESRNHLAGNCYTERDSDTNVMVHVYGPHIFHTDNKIVWDYINQFSNFIPYINRVKAVSGERVYSLPINLHTINQFYGTSYNPCQAKSFIENIAHSGIKSPQSFEDQALKFVGSDLYNAFLKGYTIKQWGRSPKILPASILKRLPLRFNYNDNYFNHRFQGMPEFGYTPIFEAMLKSDKITLYLNTNFTKSMTHDYEHIFYTGPIDAWFDYAYGHLAYRTLDFQREVHEGDYQGCAVINYNDESIPFTRVTEHKHFSPWESHDKTVIYKEYSREYKAGDVPYYPVRLVDDKKTLDFYLDKAKNQSKISFLGRLGTYRYLDMDVTISEALHASDVSVEALKNKKNIPVFFVDPS